MDIDIELKVFLKMILFPGDVLNKGCLKACLRNNNAAHSCNEEEPTFPMVSR